jgi:hypothetical protein
MPQVVKVALSELRLKGELSLSQTDHGPDDIKIGDELLDCAIGDFFKPEKEGIDQSCGWGNIREYGEFEIVVRKIKPEES